MAHVPPREWTLKDPITAAKLNEISEELEYLFERGRSIVTIPGNGTNLTTTSATYVAVDDAQFTLSIDVAQDAELRFDLQAIVRHSILAGLIHFDIIMDDVTYLSSGTATPITNGIWQVRATTAALNNPLGGASFYVSGITAGVHTFKLRWKLTTAGTITLLLLDSLCQFSVHEN